MRRPTIDRETGLGETYKQKTRHGWKKIDEVQHKVTKDIVVIYVHTAGAGKTMFDCEIRGHTIRGESIGEVKTEALAYVESLTDIEWQHVITVRVQEHEASRWRAEKSIKEGGLEVEIAEIMVTTKPVGDYYLHCTRRNNPDFHNHEQYMKDSQEWRSWRIADEGEFKPPCRHEGSRYDGGGKIYIPYSEAAWASLLTMLSHLEEIRVGLEEFMQQGDVHLRLEAMAVPLLTVTPEEPEL